MLRAAFADAGAARGTVREADAEGFVSDFPETFPENLRGLFSRQADAVKRSGSDQERGISGCLARGSPRRAVALALAHLQRPDAVPRLIAVEFGVLGKLREQHSRHALA